MLHSEIRGRAEWKVTFSCDTSDGCQISDRRDPQALNELCREAGLRQTCRALKSVPTEVMLADVFTKRSGKLRDNFRKWMHKPEASLIECKNTDSSKRAARREFHLCHTHGLYRWHARSCVYPPTGWARDMSHMKRRELALMEI